jgi:hypothetical protein
MDDGLPLFAQQASLFVQAQRWRFRYRPCKLAYAHEQTPTGNNEMALYVRERKADARVD